MFPVCGLRRILDAVRGFSNILFGGFCGFSKTVAIYGFDLIYTYALLRYQGVLDAFFFRQ